MRLSRFRAILAWAGMNGLAAIAGASPPAMQPCDTGDAALKGLLQTEYAFGRQAQSSIRAAFLEYLAEDSLVLQPGPVSGRAVYTAAKENSNKLQWYPAMAALAGSGDLGFTTGPWTYTAADGGAEEHGHFLTVWKRDAACRWQVEFDGGVSHAAPSKAEPPLAPEQATVAEGTAPPPKLIASDAIGHAIADFEGTASQNGLAAGLRTYARDFDFQFYTDGEAPMGLGAAHRSVTGYKLSGDWREAARGRSADSTLAYSVGEIKDAKRRSSHAYAEIWEYDPKVANWGLRILLINPLVPPKEKS
jgi:ketosteroid isomerase-like protein